MAETIDPVFGTPLARIEPDDRLVVLARTIQASDPGAETALKAAALDWARYIEGTAGPAKAGDENGT